MFFTRSTGEVDSQARKILAVYDTEGKPARGAHLARASANPLKYREEVEKELSFYPRNYGAYLVKWRLASLVDQATVKEMIQADIEQVGPKIEGEPAAWLQALSFGYLQLKDEPKCRGALRKMQEKYADTPEFESALGDYLYQSYTPRITGEGPAEVYGMIFQLMKRKPTSGFSRQNIQNLVWKKETPLEVTELVSGKWMESLPADPSPQYFLAVARQQHGQASEAIAPLVDRAPELYFRDL